MDSGTPFLPRDDGLCNNPPLDEKLGLYTNLDTAEAATPATAAMPARRARGQKRQQTTTASDSNHSERPRKRRRGAAAAAATSSSETMDVEEALDCVRVAEYVKKLTSVFKAKCHALFRLTPASLKQARKAMQCHVVEYDDALNLDIFSLVTDEAVGSCQYHMETKCIETYDKSSIMELWQRYEQECRDKNTSADFADFLFQQEAPLVWRLCSKRKYEKTVDFEQELLRVMKQVLAQE